MGMAQRILIALALQNNPKILIADEATSSLDAVNEKLILDLLSKISKERGLTILIITHDSRIAVNYCSDHYQIQKKRLLRFQSAQEVDKAYGKYQAILREEKIPINDCLDSNNAKNEIINMNNKKIETEKYIMDASKNPKDKGPFPQYTLWYKNDELIKFEFVNPKDKKKIQTIRNDWKN